MQWLDFSNARDCRASFPLDGYVYENVSQKRNMNGNVFETSRC